MDAESAAYIIEMDAREDAEEASKLRERKAADEAATAEYLLRAK